MTRSIDELLRDTMRDLAEEAVTATDLATGARVRGRRLRRRRRAGLVAVAILLLVVVTVPYAMLRDTARPVTQTAVWSADEPFRLPGGAVVTGVGTPNPNGTPVNLVLDRNAGRYEALPEPITQSWPAPSGRWVAIRDDSRPQPFGVRRISNGKVQWIPGEKIVAPVWSPAGARLLLTIEGGGFLVADAATGEIQEHPIDRTVYPCTEVCAFTWLPTGDQVAVPQTEGTRSPARQGFVRGLAIFDAVTGAPVRTVPVPGAPVGQGAWSPDGRLVLIDPASREDSNLRIAEVETGRVLAELPVWRAVFLADGSILGLDGSTAIRYDATGKVLQTLVLPAFLAERALSIGPG